MEGNDPKDQSSEKWTKKDTLIATITVGVICLIFAGVVLLFIPTMTDSFNQDVKFHQIVLSSFTSDMKFNSNLGAPTGWEMNQATHTCYFSNDGYHISAPALKECSYLGDQLDSSQNFIIDVSMIIHDGGGAGIFVRGDGGMSGYQFMIYPDGRYSMSELGHPIPGNYGSNPAINTGLHKTNRLIVVVVGSTYTFYANGHKLSSFTSSTYSRGYVGFVGEGGPNYDAVFFDLIVTQCGKDCPRVTPIN